MQATLNGCPIFYEVRKRYEANAPCVLLLHGWGCDHTVFSALEASLADRYTTISVDFPGHGKSGEPVTPWGVSEYMEQMYELLQQLGIKRTNV